MCYASVTCEEEGNEKVRICVVIPGVKKKFNKNLVANGNADVKFGNRRVIHLNLVDLFL